MAQTKQAATKHPVDEVLPFGQMFVYGLQHVMSMYAGVVAVPLIVGNAFGLSPGDITFLISAGLLMSGLATVLQTIGVWKLGARQPIVQGTSFAAVSTILAIGATSGGGPEALREVYGAVIVAGIIAFLIAPFFTMLLRFFPEVVTGVVITVIGISLLPVAMRWAGGGNPAAENFASPQNVALAFATVAIIVLIYRFLPGGFGRVAILLGLVLGTVVAIPFGMTNFSRIGDANIFQLTLPFHFGLPTFAIGAIISMFVVMLVTMVETTADILAIGKIIDQPATRPQVTNGLRADMLSSSVSAVFNGFTVSAFAQNVGLVAITGIKSRFVVAVGGGILVFLGLFPILGALVALVPFPVLGGAGLALFGTVAASGIRTLSTVKFDGNSNLVIVALSIAVGVIPIAVPTFWDNFPEWFQVIFDSGITSAAVMAVALNIIFNIVGRPADEEGPIFAEAPTQGAITDQDEARLTGHTEHHDQGQSVDPSDSVEPRNSDTKHRP
jgi:uric acid transporter